MPYHLNIAILLHVLLIITNTESFNVSPNDTTLTSPLNRHRIKTIKPPLDKLTNKDDLKELIATNADKGLDIFLYGPPGLGKTHSMLTYSSQVSKKIKNVKSNEPFRTLYISHSRELSIQSAELITNTLDRKNISLLIGKACKTDLISLKKRFILSTSNALSEYLLLLDSIDRKSFIQSIKLLLVDEVDALYKLPKLWAKKKTNFYDLLQAILAINKNKTQIIAASATLNRPLIRSLNNLIHTFKDIKQNENIIYIRVDDLNKSDKVLDNVQLFHQVSIDFDDKINHLTKIVTNDTLIFADHSHSLIKIKEALLKYGIESTLLHESMGIKDQGMQTMDRILDIYKNNKFQNDGVKIASMDSARGIVTMSKNIVLLGKPRNSKEFIHLMGRAVHSGECGKCTIIGDQDDIELLQVFHNVGHPIILMAKVAVGELTPSEKQELLCVYSSLLLYDDGFDITKENITKILNCVGVKVEPYLPMLFAKALKGKDLNALFGSVSSGGAVGAAPAAAGSGTAAPAAQAEKAAESDAEEEDEDDDMGFSLFD